MHLVAEFNAANISDVFVRVNIPELSEFREETENGWALYLLEAFIPDFTKCRPCRFALNLMISNAGFDRKICNWTPVEERSSPHPEHVSQP